MNDKLPRTATVDGGSNVTAAAKLLVGAERARRCANHALENFMRYMMTSKPMKKVAIAVATANYMAKFSKLSQHFAAHVGKIDGFCKTRWGSAMKVAATVYNKRTLFHQYSENNERDKNKFDEHYEVLVNGGFKVCCLFKSFLAHFKV